MALLKDNKMSLITQGLIQANARELGKAFSVVLLSPALDGLTFPKNIARMDFSGSVDKCQSEQRFRLKLLKRILCRCINIAGDRQVNRGSDVIKLHFTGKHCCPMQFPGSAYKDAVKAIQYAGIMI